MSINNESPFPVATELLVASFTPDLNIYARNEAWQYVLGAAEDIWAGMTSTDRELADQFLHDAASGELVTNRIFFIHIAQRDEPLPVLLHFIPVHFPKDRNNLSGSSTICVTVTGEVLVEPGSWVLNQTQRIRVENIGRMTLGLIHEINNMLTNVLGNIEIIETSNLLPEGSSRLADTLKTIRKAAVDGASMTKSIKSYIRNEKTSTFERLDLPSLIEDCLSFTRPYWLNEPRRNGIEIELVKDLNPVPPIMGSRVELKEVFINLITNAVQAMPRGGQLLFSTTLLEGDQPEEDRTGEHQIVVKVEDTGNGMSKKVVQRIFEPMFTTKGKQGTGMGLSICQSIIHNHDAQIGVESALGEGTTFTLRFQPADDASDAQPFEETPVSETTACILAVDDEPGVRNILANLLTARGHVVHVASSGYDALDILNTTDIDIVFTDHGMPEMNGQQLARVIRQSRPELPIVLVTGDTAFDDQLEEIDSVIGKPFFLEDLQRAINQLVKTTPLQPAG